jgi:hypothetical protein
MIDEKRKRGRPLKGTPRVYPAKVVVELDEQQFTELQRLAVESCRTPSLQAQFLLSTHLAK